MVIEVSRLVSVDPRTVWPHEAADFTPWLRDNADALADALGLDLELTATEHQVGSFFLDVIGRDLTNDSVLVVENHLGPTDHDHLGKLITYAANTDAATIVWMALSFREEHRQAIEFLNELGGEKARFFGIEIGAARIGGSLPAPLFKVVAQPNDFHAQAVAAAKVSSESPSGKGALCAEFWKRFLEQLKARHPGWTRASKGPAENWLSLPSPFKGGWASYTVSFPPEVLRVSGCAVSCTSTRKTERRWQRDSISYMNAALRSRRSFGAGLTWEPLDGRRASRIAAYGAGDIMQVDNHEEYIGWFLTSLEQLRAALDPYA